MYLLLVQAAVGAVWLGLMGHLAVNSPSAARMVSRAASDALPGAVQLGGLRLTWSLDAAQLGIEVRARDVRVDDPAGKTVIAARALHTKMALWPLLAGWRAGRVRVVIGQLELDRPLIVLENDRRGRLTLALAFADPDQPPAAHPKPFDLRISAGKVTGGRLQMQLPGIGVTARELTFELPDYRFAAVPGSPPAMSYEARRISAASVATRLDSMKQLPAIPDGSAQIDRLQGELSRAVAYGFAAQMPPLGPDTAPHTWLGRSKISSQWGPSGTSVDAEGVLLKTSTADRFVGPLLGQLFDATATWAGGFHFDAQQGFRLDGQILANGKLSGFDVGRASTTIAVQTGGVGAASVRVASENVEVLGYGGKLTSPRIDYTLFADRPEHLVRGVIAMDGMRAESALMAQGVGLPPLNIATLLATGALHGEVGVAVSTLLPAGRPLRYVAATDLDATLHRDAFLSALRQHLPHMHLVGGIRTSQDEARGLQIGLSKLQLTANGLAGHHLVKAHADGLLDLAGAASRLDFSVDVPRLEAWLEPFGIRNISGALRFDSADLHGAWQTQPAMAGELALDDLTAFGKHARKIRSRVTLHDGIVALRGLRVDADLLSLGADVSVGLFAKGFNVLRSSWPTEVANLDVAKVDLARFVPGMAGTGEIRRGHLRLDAKNWARTVGGGADVVLHDVKAGSEWLDRAAGTVSFGNGKASLAGGTALLRAAAGDLKTELTFAGNYDLTSQHFAAEWALPTVPFSLFHFSPKELHGNLAMQGKLNGTLRDFAGAIDVQLQGLGWGKIKLGDGQFELRKALGAPAILTAKDNLDSFDLLAGSELRFAGLKALNEIALKIRTHGDIDPLAVAGLPKSNAVRATIDGEVDALVNLRPGATLYTISAAMSPGHLRAEFAGGHKLTNANAIDVTLTPGKIALGPAQLALHRSEFEVCGEFLQPKDGGPLQMALFAAGSIDVPRSGAWADSLSDLDLRLDILPDPVVAADPRSQCLQSAGGKGRMRLAGPVDAPRIQGLLQTRAGKVSLRKYPHDIVIDEGGQLHIATVGDGGTLAALELSIPQEKKLAVHIDSGTLKMAGKIGLTNLKLDTIDLDFLGDEVPVEVPKQYSLRVSLPYMHVSGSNYYDDDNRQWMAKGKVVVTEGMYFRNFDKLSGVVGNAGDRRVDSYSKPITEWWPQIADLQYDLDVTGGNFEVASRFLGAKCDLVTEFAVRVTGDLEHLRVFDAFKIVPRSGSQIAVSLYSLVFDVDRGTLDFTGDMLRPYLDISAHTDIAVRGTTRTAGTTTALGTELSTDSAASEEVVQVFTQVTGVLTSGSNNFNFRLTSSKGDTEKDCQCLLLTRRRCGDSGGAAPRLSTDMLLGEAINSLATSLLKSLVDTVAVDFDPANFGGTAEITKKFGKSIALGTRVQTGREQRYTANFAFRITDRLSLNGLLRRERPVDAAGVQEAPVSVYESKLRYKVPLDD